MMTPKSALIAVMQDQRNIDTRSTELGRVKNPEDGDSWQKFFQAYKPLICGYLRRAGLNPAEADDLSQETMIEVSRRIQTFEYDRSKGTFKAWLYQLTRWRLANHFRKQRGEFVALESVSGHPESDFTIQQGLLTGNPDDVWEEEWRQIVIEAALKELRSKLPSRQFQVLDCLTAKQWSVTEIAKTFGMSHTHVYVVKCRVIMALRKEIRRLEKERI